MNWLGSWELIHAELAILIVVVWVGLRRIEEMIHKGIQAAGLTKFPEGKSKCPGCNEITHIPYMEVVCWKCREKGI